MWNKELNWIKLNCLYCSVIDHRWRPNALIRGDCVTDVFTTFSWRLLRTIIEQTHGNMESICFIRIPYECLVLNNELKRKKTDKHTCLERLEFSMICTSLDIFKSQTLVFFSASSVFLYLTCINSSLETFFSVFTRPKQNFGENILQNSESLVAMTQGATVVKSQSCG